LGGVDPQPLQEKVVVIVGGTLELESGESGTTIAAQVPAASS